MTRRRAAFAGSWYPGERRALEEELRRLVPAGADRQPAIGLVAPHAGYVYSGACAGRGYARVALPERVVILGTDHRGTRRPLAVDGHEEWETPIGSVPVDVELRQRLTAGSGHFAVDPDSGGSEHSLELQVPFLRFLRPDVRIVPVIVAEHDPERLLAAGTELAAVLGEFPGTLMVASSDLSHFIPARRARELDTLAIDCILRLDAAGLWNTVVSRRISMCGVAPATLMLAAAVAAGARRAELVEYAHSGAVSGDMDEVVGYASVLVR